MAYLTKVSFLINTLIGYCVGPNFPNILFYAHIFGLMLASPNIKSENPRDHEFPTKIAQPFK